MKKNILLFILSIFIFPIYTKAISVNDIESFTSALSSGENVELGDNITANGNIQINENITIDLNGKTLDLVDKVLVINNDVTIKDSSEEKNGNITSTASFTIQVGSSSSNDKRLTIESGKILCNGNYGVRNYGTLILNGGQIKGKDFVVYNQNNFVMNGGEVIATKKYAIQVYTNATFELNDGTVRTEGDYPAINLYRDCSATINGGQVLAPYQGTSYAGNGITAYKNTTLTVNGGLISSKGNTIMGNGSASGNSEGTNAKFIINGGTILSEIGAAIYAPQINGETIITGGTIQGRTGIEIRSGKLTVTGGTISGSGEEYVVNENSNGLTTFGAAISVAQHTTKQPIEVNISAGIIEANIALSVTNPLNNPEEDISKVHVNVNPTSDGELEFIATNSDNTILNNINDKFISGGIYTHSVEDHIVSGYGEVKENNKYVVYPYRNITISDDSKDKINISNTQALKNDIIEVTILDTKNYNNPKIEIYDEENNLLMTTTNNKFSMPNKNIIVKISNIEKIDNPNTGDNRIFILLIVLLLSIITTYLLKNKSFNL